MGLDTYFYRAKLKYTPTITLSESALLELEKVLGPELLETVKEKSKSSNTTIEKFINHALYYYVDSIDKNKSTSTLTEVAYFRKFWSLIGILNYKDPYTYLFIPKEKIEDLKEMARKTLLMVEKDLKDHGWEIEESPLNKDSNNNWYIDYKLANGIFTEEMEERADSICEKVYEESDAFLFHKTVILYQSFSDILETTDWDKEQILMEADW